ncbi:unnamed protein product [Rhizophagus irregularis]|nr:unnamed protein product [Rhizophagus irregularis]
MIISNRNQEKQRTNRYINENRGRLKTVTNQPIKMVDGKVSSDQLIISSRFQRILRSILRDDLVVRPNIDDSIQKFQEIRSTFSLVYKNFVNKALRFLSFRYHLHHLINMPMHNSKNAVATIRQINVSHCKARIF